MSWESKTDYCGLASGGNATYIQIKGANENRSSQYLKKLGQEGEIVATKLYGTHNASPSCEYTIKKAGNITVQIGKVTTIDGNRYALQQVVLTTAAGSEPTLTATSVQIESTTDGEDRMFEAVTLAVNPEETAQVVLSAATVSGTSCEITGSTCTISGTVSPHTVNGDPVASGVHSGEVEVDLTVGQYGDTAPTFAAGTNFELSQSATVNDPDSDMPEWTAKFTKPLELASSGSGT